MTTYAYVLSDAPVRLWGLDSRERLRRQIAEVPGLEPVEDPAGLPEDAPLLVLHAGYLFEPRTLSALCRRQDTALRCAATGKLAAAITRAGRWAQALAVLEGRDQAKAAGLAALTPAELGGFDARLRRGEPPLLRPIAAADRARLEAILYGTAYKGITDLVTKWLWPRPAKWGVRLCARLGITPNMVTLFGLTLVLAVCALFYHGQYALGLALGWLMTYLDTVDGKLARVTVRSSRFGHLLDHGIDIVHPPFWYGLWCMALPEMPPLLGLDRGDLILIMLGGYIGGRLIEGVFDHFLGNSVFTWRPFDAYFRLVTARRNPSLILLTASLVAGRPDWGFIAVVGWTVLSTAVLSLRLLQGIAHRLRHGPLVSWLRDPEQARQRHSRAWRRFSGTRAAYDEF